MEFEIESHEHEGWGLRSLQPGMPDVADDLREILQETKTLVHIARRKGSAVDVERLGLGSRALDVQASDSRVTFPHGDILYGASGPRVELDILRSESRGVEEVILRRSLPLTHDRAWTTDERALEIVADFLDLIGL